MARDPLRMLRTVRQLSVEQARQVLAACLTAEAAAADRLRSIDQAAERDRAVNSSAIQGHLFIEIFTRRIQVRRAERDAAEADVVAMQEASDSARAALVAARTAAEAVQTLISEQAEAVAMDLQKREQLALDDMARPRCNTVVR